MTGREKVTYHLNKMSVDWRGDSDEDVENAEYFRKLAKKNEAGTLTIKEAEEILEFFEKDSPVAIDTDSGRWVEID